MAKRYYDDARSGKDSDGSMISSGQGKHANMPTEVIMKDWGLTQVGMPENLNDTMSGIDKQVAQDKNKISKK